MHPFVISARLDNPRFRVIFDDGDSICYCNSVRSLASILEDHGRIVGVRRLRAVVGPDDRRAPRPTRREFSFEGARITRFQYPRARPRPVHWGPNAPAPRDPESDEEPAFMRARETQLPLKSLKGRRIPKTDTFV